MAEKIQGVVNMGGTMSVKNCAIGDGAKVVVIDTDKNDEDEQDEQAGTKDRR